MIRHPEFSGSQSRKMLRHRSASLLFALFLLNFSILSSYNCQSFCNLNKLYDDAYSELLILEDDSGESIAIPDSFCEVDFGSDEGSDSDDSADCEQCAYCHACSIGISFQHVPPLLLVQTVPASKSIFYQGQIFRNKQITLNNPQRAPPGKIRYFG